MRFPRRASDTADEARVFPLLFLSFRRWWHVCVQRRRLLLSVAVANHFFDDGQWARSEQRLSKQSLLRRVAAAGCARAGRTLPPAVEARKTKSTHRRFSMIRWSSFGTLVLRFHFLSSFDCR